MAIFDECDRIKEQMNENMTKKRRNVKLGVNILVFYMKVAQLAELLLIKTDWNGVRLLLKLFDE